MSFVFDGRVLLRDSLGGHFCACPLPEAFSVRSGILACFTLNRAKQPVTRPHQLDVASWGADSTPRQQAAPPHECWPRCLCLCAGVVAAGPAPKRTCPHCMRLLFIYPRRRHAYDTPCAVKTHSLLTALVLCAQWVRFARVENQTAHAKAGRQKACRRAKEERGAFPLRLGFLGEEKRKGASGAAENRIVC